MAATVGDRRPDKQRPNERFVRALVALLKPLVLADIQPNEVAVTDGKETC